MPFIVYMLSMHVHRQVASIINGEVHYITMAAIVDLYFVCY